MSMHIRIASQSIRVLGALGLVILALGAPVAGARPTRTLVASFGDIERPAGVAVDLETGNVYVVDNETYSVKVFGPEGGAPRDGIQPEFTGLHLYSEKENYEPSGIAIDNSCYEHQPRLVGKECEEYDPAYGDIYIMNSGTDPQEHVIGGPPGLQKFKLGAGGKYEVVEEISGFPIIEEEGKIHAKSLAGVAVDSRGDIFATNIFEAAVVEYKKVVEHTGGGGTGSVSERLEEIRIPESILYSTTSATYLTYVAADDRGDVYIGLAREGGREGDEGLGRLTLGVNGEVLSEMIFTGAVVGVPRPVAVEPASGVVFVSDGSDIAEYDPAGDLQLTFGSEEPLGGSLGKRSSAVRAVAVNEGAELIYVVNPSHDDVDVFGQVVSPPVIATAQPPVSDVTRTSALLAATVNPESNRASYYFEYAPAGEYQPNAVDPYAQGGRTAIAALAGSSPETVERVALTGLRPGVTYHYRIVVSNASATEYGPDETFTTAPATPPSVSTGAALAVGSTGATLTGTIDPRGLTTSYTFELGTDTSYSGAALFGDAGEGNGVVAVSIELQYLTPGTTYHYRLVATSFDGTSYGQDGTFTTAPIAPTLTQPTAASLLAVPAAMFPSRAGRVRRPAGRAKAPRSGARARQLARALRACKSRRTEAERSRCRAQARMRDGRMRDGRIRDALVR
jgi:hypothetical protein